MKMNNIWRCVLGALAAVLVGELCTGCTSVRTPSGARYVNVGFQKQFSELEYTQGTNGVAGIRIKGFRSDAEGIAEAIARGVAQGATGKP